MNKKTGVEIKNILFLLGLIVWVGTHIYIVAVGGMAESMSVAHAWINIVAFFVYGVGYVMKHGWK